MVGMSTIVYKYSCSNKSDDTIDSIILHFLKQGRLRYNSPYLGFDDNTRLESSKDQIMAYELFSSKVNKTKEDHFRLFKMATNFLRAAETPRERTWWLMEVKYHFKSLLSKNKSC